MSHPNDISPSPRVDSPRVDSRAKLDRRAFVTLGVGAFLLALTPAALRRRERLVRRTIPIMGTLAEIAVVTDDAPAAHAAIDGALAELAFVDRTMSRFRDDSDIGRANLRAAGDPVPVRSGTATVLFAALRWADATNGAFDPCVGRAVELWDVGNRTAPPDPSRLRRMAGRRLHRALEVDRHRGTAVARLSDPDAAIDLGGIAKGYAVDRAVDALRARGIARAFVNVGGDLYALGESEDGDPWRIGVRSPDDPSRLIGKLQVRDGAVATSGDYERFFEHRGTRYHHLLDPATGAPRRSRRHSLTITADTCMTADAAATAVFGASTASATEVLRRVAPDARIVEAVA